MVAVDFLTCGSCQKEFLLSNIVVFIEHKKSNCDNNRITTGSVEKDDNNDSNFTKFLCGLCPRRFSAAVSMLLHARNSHSMNIFVEDSNNANEKEKSSANEEDQIIEAASTVKTVEYKNVEKKDKSVTEENTANNSSNESSLNSNSVNTDSHQYSPKKCCTSIVPKKRKRHMEMKHLKGNHGSRVSKRKHINSYSGQSDTIYIDFESTDRNMENNFGINKRSAAGMPSNISAMRSVILQPGSTFSIPVSCYSPSSSTGVYLSATTDNKDLLGYQVRSEDSGPSALSQNTSAFPNDVVSMPTQDSNEEYFGLDQKMALSNQSAGTSDEKIDNEVEDGNQENGFSKKRRYPTSKPFKCDQCDNSFNQRIHLKKHQSKHTGVKPFKCQQCDYSTVERSHLKVHIRIHTGEKPFKCTYCEYATAQNSTLKIHLKRHHRIAETGKISCTVCGKKFRQAESLVNHEKEHDDASMLEDAQSSLGTLAEVCMRNAAIQNTQKEPTELGNTTEINTSDETEHVDENIQNSDDK